MVSPRGFDPHAANPSYIAIVLQTTDRKGTQIELVGVHHLLHQH